jgi:hypothetical protein
MARWKRLVLTFVHRIERLDLGRSWFDGWGGRRRSTRHCGQQSRTNDRADQNERAT